MTRVKKPNDFFCCQHGSIAPVAAIALILMLALVAGVVDFGSAMIARTKLSAAMDSGAIAASVAPFSQKAEDVSKRYFELNYPKGYLGTDVKFSNLIVESNQLTRKVRISSDAKYNTHLLKAFNIDTIPLAVQSSTKGTEIKREEEKPKKE